MKVTGIKNCSDEQVVLEVRNGSKISLPPGVSHDHSVDVVNLAEVDKKISYTADLTEVGKSSSGDKVQLRD